MLTRIPVCTCSQTKRELRARVRKVLLLNSTRLEISGSVSRNFWKGSPDSFCTRDCRWAVKTRLKLKARTKGCYNATSIFNIVEIKMRAQRTTSSIGKSLPPVWRPSLESQKPRKSLLIKCNRRITNWNCSRSTANRSVVQRSEGEVCSN